LRSEFKTKIVDYFLKEYAQGKTPNPCVYCNQVIKFGLLWEKARNLGADFLATGHYARVEKDPHLGWILKKGVDKKKDQSYFLYRLKRELFPQVLFPLGTYHKVEVKEIASRAGLPIKEKPESQEICFLANWSLRKFFESYLPEALKPGPIYDERGKLIGKHQGIALYTIGQRRKLGIPASQPLYVYKIDAEKNAIYVGKKEALLKDELQATQTNWLLDLPQKAEFFAELKIRSTTPPFEAKIYKEGQDFKAFFQEPQPAISPGQSAVIYQNEVLVGGGVIV
jgi:tRNA-specific 2-thiouridylase